MIETRAPSYWSSLRYGERTVLYSFSAAPEQRWLFYEKKGMPLFLRSLNRIVNTLRYMNSASFSLLWFFSVPTSSTFRPTTTEGTNKYLFQAAQTRLFIIYANYMNKS